MEKEEQIYWKRKELKNELMKIPLMPDYLRQCEAIGMARQVHRYTSSDEDPSYHNARKALEDY